MSNFITKWWARQVLRWNFVCPIHFKKYNYAAEGWSNDYGCPECRSIKRAAWYRKNEIKSDKKDAAIRKAVIELRDKV